MKKFLTIAASTLLLVGAKRLKNQRQKPPIFAMHPKS